MNTTAITIQRPWARNQMKSYKLVSGHLLTQVTLGRMTIILRSR